MVCPFLRVLIWLIVLCQWCFCVHLLDKVKRTNTSLPCGQEEECIHSFWKESVEDEELVGIPLRRPELVKLRNKS